MSGNKLSLCSQSFREMTSFSDYGRIGVSKIENPLAKIEQNEYSLISMALIFLMICLCNTVYSNGISREYSLEKDKTKEGYLFSIVPLGVSGEMTDGVGPWAGIGANYRRIDNKNYASIYPSAGYWIALMGASVSLQPIFDLDKGSFDNFRGRINLSLLLFNFSFFHDYKESTSGFTAGLEIPIPIKMFKIKDKRAP